MIVLRLKNWKRFVSQSRDVRPNELRIDAAEGMKAYREAVMRRRTAFRLSGVLFSTVRGLFGPVFRQALVGIAGLVRIYQQDNYIGDFVSHTVLLIGG